MINRPHYLLFIIFCLYIVDFKNIIDVKSEQHISNKSIRPNVDGA